MQAATAAAAAAPPPPRRHGYANVDPRCEWTRTEDADTLVVDVSGFRKEELKVLYNTSRKLKVAGERRADGGQWARFLKMFPVPRSCDAGAIRAVMDNEEALLYVILPKGSSSSSSSSRDKKEEHDHPEMVVLSKLLYGSVRVKSYDWVTPPPPCSRKSGLARVVAADEVRHAPCKTSVLFPRSGGNMHAFTAVTPCAILDVLTPPYSEELGRPSTYFNDIPIPSLPGFAFLEETDLPEDFSVAGAPYVGPELELVVDMDDDDDDYDDYDE